MAHVVFVRSTVAHGKIVSIDTSGIGEMPGVVAVYRSGEGHDLGLADFQGFPMMPVELNRPVFAGDTVRFVGDIVAAVVAETRVQAVDAAEAVIVDYEAFPVVTTAAAALAEGAPIIFPAHGSNICFATTFGDDVDALEDAEAVAEVTMVSQRLAGVPMECNALLAVPGEPNGGLTCWVSHQAPHSAARGDGAGAGARAGSAAHRLSVGGRRLRAEGRGLRRVPGDGGSGARPRSTREVDGDAVGGHGLVGPRSRLRDDCQARAQARRHDHGTRHPRHGLGRGVPGDRCDPADAHADDVARCVRRPQGPLRMR